MFLQKGFALFEIIFVLALIAVMTSFAIPAFNSWIVQTQADITKSKLLAAIQLAEISARSFHQPIVICKSKDKKSCGGEWRDGQLVFVDSNHDGVVVSSASILTVSEPSHGLLYWRGFPISRDYFRVIAHTLLESDNGTFWYCAKKNQQPLWALMISKTGRVREERPDKAGNIDDAEGKPLVCG